MDTVKGPWQYRPKEHDDWGFVRAGCGNLVATTAMTAWFGIADCGKDEGPSPIPENGDFIARSRELVPALADALEASTARVAELERIVARMNGVTNVQTARWEVGRKFHPLTCGNDSNHQPLYPICVGTEVHLKCADCDYIQTNAGPATGDQPC